MCEVCPTPLGSAPSDDRPAVDCNIEAPPLRVDATAGGNNETKQTRSHPSQPPSRVGPYLLFESCEREVTYRAVHTSTQKQYTCQILPLQGFQERLAAYDRIGKHDNICGLQDVVVGQDNLYVFLPDHHGDMHAFVRSRKHLDEEEAGRLFVQMLNAVTYCHHKGVILRDLKLRRFVFMDKYR
ncbi:hypothetical protein GOODEAATRI_028413 [Goodea atripinnis]|uniref:Protein kinase domain-containing protein n=1 Tax=Goodea atripinnis TaxID=208336 RepID=A0ABV0NYL4_9TELE